MPDNENKAVAADTAETVTDTKFTKGQLVKSKMFADYRDIIDALVDDGSELSIAEAKKRIADELKRKVD
ncbi:MAG: hypothetical protein ACI4W2_12520 [Eubacterium sp.]